MRYFESISGIYNNYLSETPTKRGCLENAQITGKVKLLPDSNNRAITIETETTIYLQSYDTLVLEYDKHKKSIKKLWHDYSVTTLKHINTFLADYTNKTNTFNKKSWIDFTEMSL